MASFKKNIISDLFNISDDFIKYSCKETANGNDRWWPRGIYRCCSSYSCLFDGEIELVCGAFSSDPEKSREMGRLLGLSANRVYGSYKEMIEEEQKTKGKNLCRKVLKILFTHYYY